MEPREYSGGWRGRHTDVPSFTFLSLGHNHCIGAHHKINDQPATSQHGPNQGSSVWANARFGEKFKTYIHMRFVILKQRNPLLFSVRGSFYVIARTLGLWD